MKLELKHLAPYLPYGLNCELDTNVHSILIGLEKSFSNDSFVGRFDEFGEHNLWQFKPILRPLSDLTKEIEVNGERL
jgi:hypothetical protein